MHEASSPVGTEVPVVRQHYLGPHNTCLTVDVRTRYRLQRDHKPGEARASRDESLHAVCLFSDLLTSAPEQGSLKAAHVRLSRSNSRDQPHLSIKIGTSYFGSHQIIAGNKVASDKFVRKTGHIPTPAS